MNETKNIQKVKAKAWSIAVVMARLLKWTLLIVLSVNIGAFLGEMLFKLILWSGLLPYLEKFFSWIIF